MVLNRIGLNDLIWDDIIERNTSTYTNNYRIIRDKLEKEVEDLYSNKVRNLVNKIYSKKLGFMGAIFKPVLNLAVNFFVKQSRNNARKLAYDSDYSALGIAFRLLKEDKSMQNLSQESFQHEFEEFLKNSEVYTYCDHNHEKHDELRDYFKKELEVNLELLINLLKSKGKDYKELIKNYFSDYDSALNFVDEDIKLQKKILNLVDKNPSILKLPSFVKPRDMIKITRRGIRYVEQKSIETIIEAFNSS